ncbi:MAG TPA: lipid A deacylase LpxR family protein [Usitatibacter sp.]|nr:lipid A deacylase LpxR family protein [Usitatibacter sp.]
MKRRFAIAACIVATAACAEDDSARWYLRVDNDFFFHTDRWYTSGVRIGRVKDGLEWGIVQELYTPEAKYQSPTLQDRAPAGRLLATVAKHVDGDVTFDTFELDAGVRGPSALGKQAQNSVHSVVDSGAIVDWERQLPDEFDVSAIAVRTLSLPAGFRTHFGAVLGNQVTFAHAGIEWRYGEPRTPSSSLMRFAATPPFAKVNVQGWSAYIGASARGVARNELLSKNYYTFGPELEKKSEVTRVAGGIAWAQPWGNLTFDLAEDSREFVGQRKPQAFGSIALHVGF